MSGRPGAAPAGPGAAARPGGPGPRGGGHGMMGMGMPAAKPKNFRESFRRLLGRLRPEAPLIVLVVVLAVVSVTFAVIGPKILGNATNDIFQGLISKSLPAGVTKDQAVAALRAQGQNQLADMLSSMHLTPGHGRRLRGARAGPPAAGRRLPPELPLQLGAGLHHGRRHPAHRVPAAPRDR